MADRSARVSMQSITRGRLETAISGRYREVDVYPAAMRALCLPEPIHVSAPTHESWTRNGPATRREE
jgi:hypothetical protein